MSSEKKVLLIKSLTQSRNSIHYIRLYTLIKMKINLECIYFLKQSFKEEGFESLTRTEKMFAARQFVRSLNKILEPNH